jgi:hypothetical protein
MQECSFLQSARVLLLNRAEDDHWFPSGRARGLGSRAGYPQTDEAVRGMIDQETAHEQCLADNRRRARDGGLISARAALGAGHNVVASGRNTDKVAQALGKCAVRANIRKHALCSVNREVTERLITPLPLTRIVE